MTGPAPRRPLVDVDGVAEYLSISPASVRRLVLHGEIPVTRPTPRAVRFDLDEVDEWLAERTTPAVAS